MRSSITVRAGALLLWAMMCASPARSGEADDGEWRMAPKDYTSRRFSALTQITSDNVKDLRVAWTFSTGVNRGHEAAPLVVAGTMYIVTPFPNYLYALDLSQPGGGQK